MKTLFVGQNSIHVESLDSTNSYASEMMRQIALPEGSLIYSFVQLKGRGQRGNSWESEPNKNVALSLVMRPKFLAVEEQFSLTKIASLAVADLMAEMLGSEEIRIKWPNDIYVKDKKIAGILIENTLKESQIQASVVGIGINVNQAKFTAECATSLLLSAGREFDLLELTGRLCELFEAKYLILRAGKLEAVEAAYLKQLYRIGEWAEYSSKETVFEGKIKGVSKIGKLQVELKLGEIKEFDLKEIRFI